MPFEVVTVSLNRSGSKWIVESKSVPQTFRYEWCSGNITRNYRVTQTGALIEYTGEKSYYQFYNKYCVDIDYETGEKIAVICNDRLVVKKCCGLTSILTKQSHNNFECQPTKNAIYLNDLSIILFGEEEKRNIEFEFEVQDQLKNRKVIEKFGMSNFTFDENQKMFKLNDETEFCLDKLNEQWIVLVEDGESLWLSPKGVKVVITIIVLLVLVVLVLYLIWKRKTEIHKLLGTCPDICSSNNPLKVSQRNLLRIFTKFHNSSLSLQSKSNSNVELEPFIENDRNSKPVRNEDATKAVVETYDEKEKSSRKHKKTDSYKKFNLGVLSDEQKGQLYQILVLMSALESNNFKFNVQSKSDSTRKFDDIILERHESKAKADILLQAKFRVDSGNLKFEDFFEANSWLELKQYFNTYYLRGQHLNFVFCTNLMAPVCINVCDSLYLEDVNQEDMSFTRFGSNEKYFIFKRTFIDYLKNKLPDLAKDENLESFVKKIILVLGFDFNDIYKKLTEKFEVENMEVCQYIVESTFLKWIESVPTRKSFDSEKCKEFHDQVMNEVFKNKVHQKSSSVYEAENQYKLKGLNYELSEFLLSESNNTKVCYVKTEPDESFYVTSKIYATLRKKLNDSEFLVAQTSWEDKLFQKVLDTTISDSSVKILLMENDGGKNLINFENKSSLLRDQKIVIIHHGMSYHAGAKKITHERIYMGRLDEASIRQISNQKVNFQGNEVGLEKLIDFTNKDILSKILLTEILLLKTISKSYSCNQDFYIQRKLVRACSKSRGDLTKLRQFINDGEEVIKEEELLEDSGKIFLIADSAGSGKTTFLQQNSKKLNQKFHNEWVIFVDLNRHRNEFTEKSFENYDKFKEFLRNNVLGLKNNLEAIVFNHALEDCRGKNINILLDGFAGSKSEKQLIQIIMNIGFKRLFITTRPEFGETLEDLTSSLRMNFVAFNKIGQEQLLGNLLKDSPDETGTESKELVSKVVSKFSESERAFHHNFGTPLILKMLAEILSSFGDNKKRLYEVDKINLNIYQLYRQFFEVKIEKYYKILIKNEKSLKSSIENFKTKLIPVLQNIAVQQIFPELKTTSNKQIAIKDDDLFYLSSDGFIQQIKQGILAEFLVVKNFISTNLTDSIWENLFLDPEFSTIRSFLVSWMETEGMNKMKYQKIHEKVLKNCKSYPNVISTLLFKDKNVRDFEVILKTLLKIGGEKNEEELIQTLVKNFDGNSNNCSIISYYFKNYEVDSEIFERSVKLFKEIINPKFSYNEFNDYSLLMISFDNFDNIFAILNLLKKNFNNEYEILHDLTFREPETMKNFLQILMENLQNFDHENVLKVIEKLYVLDIEVLKEIFMNRDWQNNTIFHLLILKQAPIEHFTKVSFWVRKVCGLQVFEELLLDGSIFNTGWLISKKVPFDYLVHIIPEIINFLNKTFSQNTEVKSFEISKKMAGKLLQGSYKQIDFEFQEIFFKLEIVKKFENNTKFFNEEIERIFLASYLHQSEDLFKEKPEKLIIPALKKILSTEFSFKKSGEERVFLKIWERIFEDKKIFKKLTSYIMKNDNAEILNLLEKHELFDILLLILNQMIKNNEKLKLFDNHFTKKLPIFIKKFLEMVEPNLDLLLKLFETIKKYRGIDSLKTILLAKRKFEENPEMNLLEILLLEAKIQNFLIVTFENDKNILEEISFAKLKSVENG